MDKEIYVSDNVINQCKMLEDFNGLTTKEVKSKLIQLINSGENIVFKERKYLMYKNNDYNIGIQVDHNRINYITHRETGRTMYINYRDEYDMLVAAGKVVDERNNLSIWDFVN